ncbi:diguanylate cyclase/phosphodiesterase (GGDEF & EAL domains) with PAS/PAC sensor(s) [hydrothermal vent metagenome]|uniref:Diguanylate cyclase/phosphodiesterase (GGDEF & EAL domains) with PAS/PAC sensor(S) n=1 Tax=hydrothermal vent metagenome TaxID=652676 RepID=A0A1W1CJH0_9ZZZZ
MLLSQKEERGRRFTLALRAGIPVLILVFLVFFTTIYKDNNFIFNLKDSVLLGAITFITIYFIYFLMNLSVQETMIDQTTQGFNKKALIKKLEQTRPQIIACLTIQNLHSLNENYSTEQIDTLLYTITHQLNLLFKQHGFDKVLLGRYRGAEFLIALDGDAQSIRQILEQMIQKNHLLNEIEIDYKFAVITNSSQDFKKIILQLRDLIQSQSVEMQTSPVSLKIQDDKILSSIEKSVISSLKEKNLLLSFRPLLNTYTDTIDTYEIAVKLKASTTKEILPRVYLPIINRLGLGREYDLALAKHIIDLLPLVSEQISFTFNLSPFSLRDQNFQEQLFSYLKEKKVNPHRLIIQLYERKTHHDLKRHLKMLKHFRSQGIRICIDNFGSSNASMEYMKHFRFDMVQFDRDYVTHLEDNTTYAMLNSLIKMSKDLQVQTVAKWVDNEEQKRKLHLLGINYIQGFGVSKALNETDLIHRYNN